VHGKETQRYYKNSESDNWYDDHSTFLICSVALHSLSLSLSLDSCYGQSLLVSTYLGETLYAIFVAVIGLVLFAHLIGNVQVLLSTPSLLLTTRAN